MPGNANVYMHVCALCTYAYVCSRRCMYVCGIDVIVLQGCSHNLMINSHVESLDVCIWACTYDTHACYCVHTFGALHTPWACLRVCVCDYSSTYDWYVQIFDIFYNSFMAWNMAWMRWAKKWAKTNRPCNSSSLQACTMLLYHVIVVNLSCAASSILEHATGGTSRASSWFRVYGYIPELAAVVHGKFPLLMVCGYAKSALPLLHLAHAVSFQPTRSGIERPISHDHSTSQK
jgi:hypothetical protein